MQQTAAIPCDYCKTPVKSIDDLFNQTIEILTSQGRLKEISARLLSLTNNYDKVLYVYNILRDLSLLPRVRTNPKNDTVSAYYRSQGNEFFKHRKDFEAWQCYNMSLLYAVTTSENFIYAVSNRSAVFFAMGKYKECLQDIKFVFNTQFPENLRNKLLERKAQCLIKLEAQGPENNRTENVDLKIKKLLEIKGPRDKKYICSSSKLKVVHTEEMGRHIIANEDIGVGEVLAEENPYLTVLLQSEFLFSCAYCLSRNMNLYPCMSCTYSLYCSIECRETAIKKYHLAECEMLGSVLGMGFTKLEMLALRVCIRSKTDEDSWLKARDVADAAESNINTNKWGCVKVGKEWIYDSKYYTSIHTLATNEGKRSISDIFRKCLTAAVCTHFLSVVEFLKSKEVMGGTAIRHVTGTLFLHNMTSPTNMHSISTNIRNGEQKYVDEYQVASGAYAFFSLLNHSCTPNVVRYSKLGTAEMSLIAIRPIKKGMQLYDNYGYHYAIHDRKTRQDNLSYQYKFTCKCQACLDDWPLHADLKEITGIPVSILRKKDEFLTPFVIELLMIGDKETAVNCYKPLCELIKLLEPFAPCKELAECQESLKQCLTIFYGVVPYEQSKVLRWQTFPTCRALGGPPHVTTYLTGPSI